MNPPDYLEERYLLSVTHASPSETVLQNNFDSLGLKVYTVT
jgi:hypothetical protein